MGVAVGDSGPIALATYHYFRMTPLSSVGFCVRVPG